MSVESRLLRKGAADVVDGGATLGDVGAARSKGAIGARSENTGKSRQNVRINIKVTRREPIGVIGV